MTTCHASNSRTMWPTFERHRATISPLSRSGSQSRTCLLCLADVCVYSYLVQKKSARLQCCKEVLISADFLLQKSIFELLTSRPICLWSSTFIEAAVANTSEFYIPMCGCDFRLLQMTWTRVKMVRWPTPSGRHPWAVCSRLTLWRAASPLQLLWTERSGHKQSEFEPLCIF